MEVPKEIQTELADATAIFMYQTGLDMSHFTIVTTFMFRVIDVYSKYQSKVLDELRDEYKKRGVNV